MDQLGVPGPCDGDDPDRKMAPFDDPRWQTELGQAIFADVIRVKAETSLDSYSNEESESDSSEDKDESARVLHPPRGAWDWGWNCEVEEA